MRSSKLVNVVYTSLLFNNLDLIWSCAWVRSHQQTLYKYAYKLLISTLIDSLYWYKAFVVAFLSLMAAIDFSLLSMIHLPARLSIRRPVSSGLTLKNGTP